MKKALWILSITLVLSLILWQERFQDQEPTLPPSIESKASSAIQGEQAHPPLPVAAPHTSEPSSTSPIDTGLLQLILNHKLSPDSLEAYAQKQGFLVHREIQGQLRSGQRLVLKISTIPESRAVFDIMQEGAYQLSAVRTDFPKDTDLKELKAALKSQVHRPIDREDEQSLVFKSDEQGLVVWLAQNPDGSIKLASEYVSQEHSKL